jgi:hypothetical protein
MQILQDFFLKNRLVVMKLARDLLVTELDERLQTIDYYVERFSISRGTVQAAMMFLIEQGCITTQFRGHLGTYLLTKNNDNLWEYSGFGTLSCAMSLPLNDLASGLATGVCDCMQAANIAFNCVFIQGSRTRLNGLSQGKYDFIIASNLTKHVILEKSVEEKGGRAKIQTNYSNIEKVMELHGCSYSGRYALLFADPSKTEVEDGMTVAVDPTSVDQLYLTKVLCKNKSNIKFNELTYINTRHSVKNMESDVTVTRMDVIESLDPDLRDHTKELRLPNYSRKEIDAFTVPVILALKDNYGMKNLLQRVLRFSVVSNSQKKVMSGQRAPTYY